MKNIKTIQVFEHNKLCLGGEFKEKHLTALASYLTQNESCGFYTLLYNGVRFAQYVGVLQVDDLTIEVLPKTDRHNLSEDTWHDILIDMLKISLHVQAKTTTNAAVKIKKLTVLDAYLFMFLEEVERLFHGGLVKKYRKIEGNQTALKGRLLFNKHTTKNVTHAERFYISYTTYDKNNIYNAILYKALNTILTLYTSKEVKSKCNTILFDFPECENINVSQKTFKRLNYDRKANNYKSAIELARIILLNYHPDFKGGNNNILAIMVDMNELWENYIYFVLKRASFDNGVIVLAQQSEFFWTPDGGNTRTIRPDIVIKDKLNEKFVVLDTKWKYLNKPSVEDIRQMYTYGHYFNADQTYLIYPDKSDYENVIIANGNFIIPEVVLMSKQSCGLMKVDLIKNGTLNKDIGQSILSSITLSIK